jgi:hypothetical protein
MIFEFGRLPFPHSHTTTIATYIFPIIQSVQSHRENGCNLKILFRREIIRTPDVWERCELSFRK